MVEIADAGNRVVYASSPNHQHWMDSGVLMSVQVAEADMVVNAEYTVNVTVWTVIGQISEIERFGEMLHCTSKHACQNWVIS